MQPRANVHQQSLQTIGAINTAYTVGAIVAGWFMGGPIADYFGRRVSSVEGINITTLAGTLSQFSEVVVFVP